MTTTIQERTAVSVLPWGIEADTPRNSDILLQCIPGCRLRSAIDGTKPVLDAWTGEPRVPIDQSIHFSAFPKTPGMQIFVDPAKLTYEIVDPLRDNEELLEKVRRYIKEKQGFNPERMNGLPKVEGKLDVHRMKSLCREMLWLVSPDTHGNVYAKRVKGSIPAMEDIQELPGKFLLNPGSRVGNTQPVFEDQWDDWVQSLSRSGG